MPSDLALAPQPRDLWLRLKALVLDSLTSAHSRRAYGAALEDFYRWSTASGWPCFNKATIQHSRAALEERHLAPSSINIRLSALRKLASEAADNGVFAPEAAAASGRVTGRKSHATPPGLRP